MKDIVDELREMKWKKVHNQEPQVIYDLLLRAADTIESLTTKGKKCIVKGCTNHSNEGAFEGALCMPCHRMITEGVFGCGNTIFHRLEQDRQILKKSLVKIQEVADFGLGDV